MNPKVSSPVSGTVSSDGTAEFAPVLLLQVELSAPVPALSLLHPETGVRYSHALSLVRLHTEPLGLVELRSSAEGLSAREYAREIWDALSDQINEHLRQDGLPTLTTLDAGGIDSAQLPKCRQERLRLLANPPFVTIIIATRERPESLATCLRALARLDYPCYEIVVVDNAPATENTADLVKQMGTALPHLHYVREDTPGLGWAHNAGLRHAKGGIIALTDDDVVVDRLWLAELVYAFSQGDKVGCVTGLIVPIEIDTPAQLWFEQHGGFSKGFAGRIYDMRGNRPADPLYPYRASMFGSGANMAFTASVLRSVGGFDAALGPGTLAQNGEDIDAYFRVIMAGYQLAYHPAALVHHAHRRDYRALQNQIYTYGVGLTAFLTKSLVRNPRLILDLMLKLPYALTFTFRFFSKKDTGATSDYPAELKKLQLRGFLYGPVAYLRSDWNVRRAHS